MASSHRSARFGRAGHRALLALAAASAVVLAPLPAVAAPEATTSQEAAALVAERAHQLEVVTEQFNDARVELQTKQAEAAQAGERVVAAEATVVTARDQVRQVARSAYTGDSLSTLQAMLSSESADEMLDRVGTLGTIADHNNELLSAAQQATEDADAAKAAAEKAAADAQALVDQVAAQQADLNVQIAEYQDQYDRLNAAEQEASRAAAERAHAAEAAAAAESAAAESAASSSSAGSSSASSSAGSGGESAAVAESAAPVASAGGAAATAVATAMAQQGKPYVWAAAGPNSFDCSGLVQYAYAAAGISLPHSSAAQARAGQAVSRDQLQPGDLIAFYSPVSHIGIYIGNGQMVHAPTSGSVVKTVNIDYMGAITAMRRVG